MRRIAALAGGLALVAAACTGGPTQAPPPGGAQTFTVQVDRESPEGKNLQYSAYFPGSLKVRPGDSVVLENRSTQAPHTVTFGIDPDRGNAPRLVTGQGAFNPVVFAPCFSAGSPTPGLEACPTQPRSEPPPLTGEGYWNSGLLVPAVAPEGQRKVRVEIARGTAPGRYSFVCLLHPFMAGTLEVVGPDAERPSPAEVSRAGEKEFANVASADREAPTSSGREVAVGWGDRVVSVNRFGPAQISVSVGDTVTWRSASPYEPHTVTFESPFESPEEEGTLAPGGPQPGGDYTGGFAHSGFIGASPFFPTDSYSLRFAKPGSYSYMCILHPGMAGVVNVS